MKNNTINNIGIGMVSVGAVIYFITPHFISDCETRTLKGAHKNLDRTILRSYIYNASTGIIAVGSLVYAFSFR